MIKMDEWSRLLRLQDKEYFEEVKRQSNVFKHYPLLKDDKMIFDNINKPELPAEFKFGEYFAPYMIQMDYNNNRWQEVLFKRYGKIGIEPGMSSLHYGQAVFEGQKVYKTADGGLNIFRPLDNFDRFNASLKRMCMPELRKPDIDVLYKGLKKLILLNKDWVPEEPSNLYIRMHAFASENFIGIRPATEYKLFIICSPVPPYLNGFAPTKLMIPEHYTRASIGGTGEAKSAGNYDGTLVPVEEAHTKGYSNCVFLRDGGYITECSAANIFFVINNKIVTPMLDGTILHGITRDSIIKLFKQYSFDVDELLITVNDLLFESYHGNLNEIFMTGTAACVIPVSELLYKDQKIKPTFDTGLITTFIYEKLTDVLYSRSDDDFGWVVKVN